MRRQRPPSYPRPVPSFLVFRDLPGVTRDQYAAAQRAAADAARRTGGADREVTYQGGFFLPAVARAICIFHAETAADVIAVNELAGLPTTSIVEAIDLRHANGHLPAP
jgi:hypothetical protein